MADDYQIRRTFNDLGTLYAAEHHENDDQGVQMVQSLVGLLRRFKAHEDAEHARDPQTVREASYQLPDGRAVYFDDGRESLRDATDVYQVTPELDEQGSPNLENLQARHLVDLIQRGHGLSEHHIGTLRHLLNKHKRKVAALRHARADRPDWLALEPPTPQSRIIDAREAH